MHALEGTEASHERADSRDHGGGGASLRRGGSGGVCFARPSLRGVARDLRGRIREALPHFEIAGDSATAQQRVRPRAGTLEYGPVHPEDAIQEWSGHGTMARLR